MTRHIVLLGLMGAGKTTVGRALATELGRPLRDSDADIRAATGRSAREIDEARGTAELHRVEADHLIDALGAAEPSVICAAASTIDDPACRAALVGPDLMLVWLRAEPGTLVGRARPAGHRRDLGPDRAAKIADQAAARYPMFDALRPLTIDAEGRSPKVIARLIARQASLADR